MKVLYLSEWYPNRYDAMLGLFVRKHAEAIARQGAEVIVLYLYADHTTQEEEIIHQTTNGVHEIYVYYNESYLCALMHGYREVKRTYGLPDICQLNVITKHGLLPLYLKLWHHIPYVIVEHWTGYTPQNPSIRGGWHLHLMHTIAQHAEQIMPVSQNLIFAMQNHGFKAKKWSIINNVVDDFFYTPRSVSRHETIQLAHISCFDNKAKNIPGILRAIQRLSQERQDFHLHMIGTGRDYAEDVQYAHELGIDSYITFTGELAPQEVKHVLEDVDIFILFSNYENAPVVISESLAMGIPVLSTNVGGIAQMVPETCGRLIDAGDEDALYTNLQDMLNHYMDFDKETIRRQGAQYSYDAVGKELINIYKSAL